MAVKKQESFMLRAATAIVDKRRLIYIVFAALCLFSVFSRGWVTVYDSLTDDLADDTETRQGLDLMAEEFTTYGTADVMIEPLTFAQAQEMQAFFEEMDGVKEVAFSDDPSHYSGTAALFTVTFDGEENDDISIDALAKIRKLVEPYDSYIYSNVGNPLKQIINREMLIVDGLAAIIVTAVLLLTSRTYAEVPILLATFGAAALLNMGTNFLMGPISFVTDSIAIVLQLALAVDYAIILLHRFMEERGDKDPREAAIVALSKAIPEIAASSLTTVSGLLALCFMHYRLGLDLGTVLIKAILLSLCSVFLFMPGLLVTFSKALDKSAHRSFIPKIPFLGRFAHKTRFIVPPVFAVILVAAALFSNKASYVYDLHSVDSIRHNEEQLALQHIKENFTRYNRMAIIVPTGDYESENALVAELSALPRTAEITALANVEAEDGFYLTTPINPRDFSELADIEYEAAQVLFSAYAMQQEAYGQIVTNLNNYRVPLLEIFTYLNDQRENTNIRMSQETIDKLDDLEEQLDDAKRQLKSERYSRIVVDLDLPVEEDVSYDYLNIIHGCIAKYYDEYYVVGDTTSCNDLQESFLGDNKLISFLSILFVIIVLIFSFKSAGLPVLLIVVIQGSIWINFSQPFLRGVDLYFLTYLIISAIQMGANIDYAIVISSRYLECKESLPVKEAMIETLNAAFPTVITSGSMMAGTGIAIGFVATNETISAIGVYLGTGTLISMFLVMCVLPQILLLGDTVLEKTRFSFGGNRKPVEKTGAIRIDGRVRGTLEGTIDAEIHGVFHGTLNAVVTMGAAETLPDSSEESTGKEEIL